MELVSISLAFEKAPLLAGFILLLQVVTALISLERFAALFLKRKADQLNLAKHFEDPIRRGEIKLLIEKTENMTAMTIARATLAGAKAAQLLGGSDEIRGRMDEVLIPERVELSRRTGLLFPLASVAILSGLLGFALIVVNEGNLREAAAFAAYGLITAIPAFLMFGFLQNRTAVLLADLDLAALKVFHWLNYAYEPAGFQSLRPRGRPGASLDV